LSHGGAQLSGGEQQMLAIGRALMTNPELLILDEATEGLAPQVAHEIWQIVRRIKATGMATLIVDRNHEALKLIADRCVVLLKGAVVFDAPAAQLDDEAARRYLGV
jgi:branched-chain amino acid transport system ATP-binding protein